MFCITKVGNEYFANSLGPGFLLYQQKAVFKAKMQETNDRKALVMCRDLDGTVWASDQTGGLPKRYDGKTIDPQRDAKQVWTDFHGADLDGKVVPTQLDVYGIGT